MSLIAALFVLVGCSESGFTGSAKAPGKTATKSDRGGENATPTASPAPATSHDGALCVRDDTQLDAVIVVDRSSSMTAVLQDVKSNVAEFARRLSGLKSGDKDLHLGSVRVGVVTFVDTPDSIQAYALTPDVETLAAQLGGLQVAVDPRNVDIPEAGGLGLAKALDLLSAQDAAADSLRLIVYVSDTYAHDGTGAPFQRDFSLSVVKRRLGTPPLDRVLLYDAVPQVGLETAYDPLTGALIQRPESSRLPGEPATPIAQMQDLRSAAAGGASVGYPLDASTLLNKVPEEIGKAVTTCE
jgi:hypothetical protein